MEKIAYLNAQNPEQQALLGAMVLKQTLFDLGLYQKFKVEKGLTRKGDPLVSFQFGQNEPVKVVSRSGLETIVLGDIPLLYTFLSRCLPKTESAVTSVDLLNQEGYSSSCLAVGMTTEGGNELLNFLAQKTSEEVPCFYGSTGGLNFAELLETIVCTQRARDMGISAYTLFDFTEKGQADLLERMHNDAILSSTSSFLSKHGYAFGDFCQMLGNNSVEQQVSAARMLSQELEPVVFVHADRIVEQMSRSLTLGKLLLLAKIAGSDPVIADGIKASRIMQDVTHEELGQSVSTYFESRKAGGMVYYARDGVLAADFAGSILFPLKMTTHANIYKVWSSYGSLYSQRRPDGAILCPIQKHRIQTQKQARLGGDPCDVRLLAFLKELNPEGYNRLHRDFMASCQVLNPSDAIAQGTGDKKFIVESYFPELT